MAVIDSLGISVHVQIDGTAAVEYVDPDPSPDVKYPTIPVVSRYIESKDGTEYAIACMTLLQHSWLSRRIDYRLSFAVHIDGMYQARMVYGPAQHVMRYSMIVDGVRVQPLGAPYETLSKFKFDKVTPVDRDFNQMAEGGDIERAAGLGSIRVEVWRSLFEGLTYTARPVIGKTDMSIAEKALKGRAIAHATSLSAPIVTSMSQWCIAENLYEKPYVIFEFKYRSKDGLRNEMIVPRTPSPNPVVKGIAGLSQEEVLQLAEERLAQIMTEKKPVTKREFDEPLDLTGEGDDGLPRPFKMRRSRKAPEIIDLTDD